MSRIQDALDRWQVDAKWGGNRFTVRPHRVNANAGTLSGSQPTISQPEALLGRWSEMFAQSRAGCAIL